MVWSSVQRTVQFLRILKPPGPSWSKPFEFYSARFYFFIYLRSMYFMAIKTIFCESEINVTIQQRKTDNKT